MGQTQLLLRIQGDAAPIGGNYSTFPNTPVTNANGQVAFLATLSGGSSNQGIFLTVGTSVDSIAVNGGAAPGTDATFTSFTPFSVRLDDSGIVAFAGSLVQGTGGVTAANDTGIWYGSSKNDLTLLAREGDAIVVNGTSRILDSVPNGSAFSMNEIGIVWSRTLYRWH